MSLIFPFRYRLFLLTCFFFLINYTAECQLFTAKTFSRNDTLQGSLSIERTSYDVKYYHLDVKVIPEKKFIEGSNTILFEVVSSTSKIQLDLYHNMNISAIEYKGKPLSFSRELNAVFITFEQPLSKGTVEEIKVSYSGHPKEAPRAPWDGGFVWSKDKEGNPWIGVAVQGDGASLWWPCKDHQSDEPDSMLLSVAIPKDLTDVSNGNLRKQSTLPDGYVRYDWFISYPINTYNATLNIGKFAHFHDFHLSGKDTLDLDYYVMPHNLQRAKERFKVEVPRMLNCFERHFGQYPFIRDGFKLIETPYDGMEHQSAISYGNHDFYYGHNGKSNSDLGLKFDFIIVHEAAHEWWGNNLTSNDIADMWIHESFGAYAESIFIECYYGYKEALRYVNGSKSRILNDRPIIGIYGVNYEGSGDMYIKGALVLNTLRHVIGNDKVWFDILKGLQKKYAYKTLNAEDVFNFINEKAGKDFTPLFKEYFYTTEIPELEVQISVQDKNVSLKYRWKTTVNEFNMPVKVTLTNSKEYTFIYPTSSWQSIPLQVKPEEFNIDADRFLVNLKKHVFYLDKNLKTESAAKKK